MNTTECPNGDKILAHARYRGLIDARLENRSPYGWYLIADWKIEESGSPLLGLVIDELGISRGCNGQIVPEKYTAPWSTVQHGPGRPLLGYLGCPVIGHRHNNKKHPGSGKETVDTLCFDTATPQEARRAVEHFEKLGYLCWIEGTIGDGYGAALFIPKFNAFENFDNKANTLFNEIVESLEAVFTHNRPLFPRIVKAVIGEKHERIDTLKDIRTSVAIAFAASRNG